VNESAAKSLRSLQKDHALILLHEQELETLRAQGALAMPERHREHFVKVMRRAGAWQALVSDGRGDLCTVTVEKSVMHIHSATQPAPPAHARATVTLIQRGSNQNRSRWFCRRRQNSALPIFNS
jgi:hypothetical protein